MSRADLRCDKGSPGSWRPVAFCWSKTVPRCGGCWPCASRGRLRGPYGDDGNDGLAKAEESLARTHPDRLRDARPRRRRALPGRQGGQGASNHTDRRADLPRRPFAGQESAADEVIQKPKSPGDTQEMFARIRSIRGRRPRRIGGRCPVDGARDRAGLAITTSGRIMDRSAWTRGVSFRQVKSLF